MLPIRECIELGWDAKHWLLSDTERVDGMGVPQVHELGGGSWQACAVCSHRSLPAARARRRSLCCVECDLSDVFVERRVLVVILEMSGQRPMSA